jgi:hypothetical protein
MKRVFMILAAAGMMIAVSSCTKEGPQGPPGTDANATCSQCHDFTDTIVAKVFQYDASQHATGSTVFEATRTACAPCHSSQGFEEVIQTNLDTTAAPIANAAEINCRTCHQIHTTYTNADWALKTTASFTTRTGASLDLAAAGGSANLCARCHQPRKAAPWITDPNGTDSLNVTSTRWGPHHGPQGTMVAGLAAFEIGGATYGNSPHRNVASCGTCHGGYAQGDLVGGHTLHMTNPETGDNVKVCQNAGCHPEATDFDIDGVQTQIRGMYQTLKVQLATAGVLDTNTMLLKKKGKYTEATLAVYWNFCLVDSDRSMGVHNYKYTRDMLQAGINYFNAKGF